MSALFCYHKAIDKIGRRHLCYHKASYKITLQVLLYDDKITFESVTDIYHVHYRND